MEATRDTEMRARIGRVSAQMQKLIICLELSWERIKLLNMVNNLSRSLQAKTLSACEGQKLVSVTLVTLQSIRSEPRFDLFWQYVESQRSVLNVSRPELPRCRKVPRRFEVGETPPQYPASTKDHFQRKYFEGIDLVIAAIKSRFEQQGFRVLQKLEVALLEKRDEQHSEVVNKVVQFYDDDFNHKDHLEAQLVQLHAGSEKVLDNVQAVFEYVPAIIVIY